MCCNRESIERVLELQEMVSTDDLKGCDPFDTQIKIRAASNFLLRIFKQYDNRLTLTGFWKINHLGIFDT